jgi:hypothetical protein
MIAINEREFEKMRNKCYDLKNLYEALGLETIKALQRINGQLSVDIIPGGVSLNLGDRVLVRLEEDGKYVIIEDLKQKIAEYASELSGDILADINEFIHEKDC